MRGRPGPRRHVGLRESQTKALGKERGKVLCLDTGVARTTQLFTLRDTQDGIGSARAQDPRKPLLWIALLPGAGTGLKYLDAGSSYHPVDTIVRQPSGFALRFVSNGQTLYLDV